MVSPLKIIFAGTPEFAAVSLEALLGTEHQVCAVYTQPDRPAGRGRKLTHSPVKQLALEQGISVLQPVSLKHAEAQQRLESLQADVMVVVAYGLILPPAVLQAPRFGCLNVHASLLPRWRGAAPIQRAILAGDSETGVTIMQMDEGLDTGAMLNKVVTAISDDDTAQTLHDCLAQMGAEALVNTLNLMAADNPSQSGNTPEVQDNSQATYAAKLDKSEAKINWQQSAVEIHRMVRAFNPWPVAQTHVGDTVLRIWEARQVMTGDIAPDNTAVGSVVAESKSGIDVLTGEGILRITTLQMPGGRPLLAGDFINAKSLVGSILS